MQTWAAPYPELWKNRKTGVDPTLETLCENILQTLDFVQQNVCRIRYSQHYALDYCVSSCLGSCRWPYHEFYRTWTFIQCQNDVGKLVRCGICPNRCDSKTKVVCPHYKVPICAHCTDRICENCSEWGTVESDLKLWLCCISHKIWLIGPP